MSEQPAHPRAALAASGLRPKKRFGQNFLMDAGAVRKIAALCEIGPGDRVLEVGPGTGALTAALAATGAAVTAVEIDPELVAVLRARADLAGVTLLLGDALEVDAGFGDGPWTAAGNLPYNVATPLILGWLEARNPPRRIVAMVQRDVADRFAAKPSTPPFGSLSLAVQYRASVRRAMTLQPSVFYPRPNVESAVVVLDRHAVPPVAVRDEALLLQVVRAAFAYRRKTLANGLLLALGIDRTRTQAALVQLALDPETRGEQLDLGAFGALADALGG